MRISCPSTLEFIAFQAQMYPQRIAVVHHDQSMTYMQLYRQGLQMITALRALGIKKGDTVAVEDQHFVLHLLMLLALDEMGVLTLSYLNTEVGQITHGLNACDLVICHEGTHLDDAGVGAPPRHVVHQEWLDQIFTLKPAEDVFIEVHDPDAPFRLVKSSGTTGRVKFMVHSRAVRMSRVRLAQVRRGFSPDTRVLVLMSFSVEGLYQQMMAALQCGGRLVRVAMEKSIAALEPQDITDIIFLPIMLRPFLEQCERLGVTSKAVTAVVVGGRVEGALRTRALASFARDIQEIYGTNEVGSVCWISPSGEGDVMPGVRIQTVDEAGQPFLNQIGQVRIQCDGQINEYWQDEATTAQKFKDGWFYPGDLGIMKNHRTLTISGRVDDLLNVNGLKVIPYEFEQELAEKLGLEDVCLLQTMNTQHEPTLWLVYATTDAQEPEGFRDRMQDVLPKSLRPITIYKVTTFPRTVTGKIKRTVLKEMLAH